MEDGTHTARDERRFLVLGNDAADDDAHVAEPGVAERGHQLGHDEMVGGERRDADDVDVLLERELDDRGNALPRRRVDHLHAGVAARGGDDAAAAVVAVEADLGDEHARSKGGRCDVVHGELLVGIGARYAATLDLRTPTKRRAICAGVAPPSSWYHVWLQFKAPTSSSRSIERSVRRASGSAATRRAKRFS